MLYADLTDRGSKSNGFPPCFRILFAWETTRSRLAGHSRCFLDK